MIEINQIIRRSEQGVTRPYICKDEAGEQLWVKGSAWLASDLASEWICAQLAKDFGLPVADFNLVHVSHELIEHSAIADIASLGAGIGFGSVHVSGASELKYGTVSKIDQSLQADVLLFDYWIQNDDRGLGELGGNPNLLWKLPERKLKLIDHNNAFDPVFDAQIFFKNHAFRDARSIWDDAYCTNRHEKLLAILSKLPDKLATLPDEWFFNDEDKENPLKQEIERMKDVLYKVEKDPREFWKVTP